MDPIRIHHFIRSDPVRTKYFVCADPIRTQFKTKIIFGPNSDAANGVTTLRLGIVGVEYVGEILNSMFRIKFYCTSKIIDYIYII